VRKSLLVVGVLLAACGTPGGETPDSGAHDSGVIDAGFDAGVYDAGIVDAGDPCSTFVITPPASLNFWRGQSASRAFLPNNAQFEVTSGELPPGMTVDELGVLSGTPTFAGLYEFDLLAVSARCNASLSVVVSIDCPLITVTQPQSSSVYLGHLLSEHFTQTGATSPSFFVSDGELPPWANLAADGTLTAVPDYNESRTFRVTAQDYDGCFGQSAPYTLSAMCPPEQIFARTIRPDGTQIANYLWNGRDLLFERGIDKPIALVLTDEYEGRFMIVDGGLPPGVSLDAGVISGVPTSFPTGEGRFVVRAEFNGCSFEQELNPLWCQYVNLPTPAAWTPANYVVGNASDELGWVNGTSAYRDLQKANFYDVSSTDFGFIDDVLFGFGAAASSGPQQYVEVRIYDGETGVPSDIIDSDSRLLSFVQRDIRSGSLTSFFKSNSMTQLPDSKRFFVSVNLEQFTLGGSTTNARASFTSVGTLADAGGEQLSILSNSDGETNPSIIWEQHADGGWSHYGDADSWNLNASLMIFPNVCK
jgi:hypothetical protein